MLKDAKTYSIHALLWITALITTTIAGAENMNQPYPLIYAPESIGSAWNLNGVFTAGWRWGLTWNQVLEGLYYSVPFMTILTAHELGHYITARLYKLKVSLPYFIPIFIPGASAMIGSMGAIIRIKSLNQTKKQYFDVGIAGPLAGYVLAIGLLFYGFTHLPPKTYLLECDPNYELVYEKHGADDFGNHLLDDTKNHNSENPSNQISYLSVGQSLTFLFFENVIADKERVPSHFDMIHYPFIFCGFIALFFTSLNLIPIGQFDGGHILYGLVGYKKSVTVSRIIYTLFVFYAGLGFDEISIYHVTDRINLSTHIALYLGFLYLCFKPVYGGNKQALIVAFSMFIIQFGFNYFFPTITGYYQWLILSIIIARLMGVFHPKATIEEPMDMKRKILGWIALVIFLISFSPKPFDFVAPTW